MYAVENVVLFLTQCAALVGDRADAILARAERHAVNGLFHFTCLVQIMDGDTKLVEKFEDVVANDDQHTPVAIRASLRAHHAASR